MPLFINTNVTSLNSQRNLLGSAQVQGSAFQRLSSGLRINSAKDDAAGQAISQRMTSQVRGYSMAIRNANDGISLTQVADGAMTEVVQSLQRIRELAVQSANASLNDADRANLQAEADQRVAEIDRIAKQTVFNETPILKGFFDPNNLDVEELGVDGLPGNVGESQTLHVGADEDKVITFSVGSVTAKKLLGAIAEDPPSTPDIPAGPGGIPPAVVGIPGGSAVGGVDAVAAGAVDISNSFNAEATITQIDAAIASVVSFQADLGALQNRFQAVIENLASSVENISAARSRIVDADIAEETSKLTKASILQQAGTAVLAQANQQPQLALQLLG
ncbi:MAG: flagellin FliC [Magnetococcales bacterium]|nr:flagellin FliC [Magnetococcales bacterium]MBF0156054.1 flagellin FliC [Magnetococcales bacterium]